MTSSRPNDATEAPKVLSDLSTFWNQPIEQVLAALSTTAEGLTEKEARQRLARYGPNLLKPKRRTDTATLLLAQFTSPIILILIFASILSYFLGDPTDSVIILVIVGASGLLSFWQERDANKAVDKLLATVQISAAIVRNGKQIEIPVEQVVPGDILVVNAGDGIPGDSLLLKSTDLYVDEAALTGETFPVAKDPGVLPKNTPLAKRSNALFMGTHVISGTGQAVIVRTGTTTEFGRISERLKQRPPETEFEHSVRHFGYLLLETTLTLVIAIFAFNVYLQRPVLESFLFALALAVGLTPQLLPAIISINLARGAKHMADDKVIVKRLAAIENFGSMDVLCSDKTGTLTEGTVKVHSAIDTAGNECEKVMLYAYLNACYESGFTNPIDQAIRVFRSFNIAEYQKLDEVPYDFIRKRLSILVERNERRVMITKGALDNVLSICTAVELPSNKVVPFLQEKSEIQQRYRDLSDQGFRVLGIAYRDIGSERLIEKHSETDMTFLGFIVLYDPPKQGIVETIKNLRALGITLKVITGDNHLVARHIGQQVGLSHPKVLVGQDLSTMSDEALLHHVDNTDIFAEVEPNQKERLLLAIKKAGHVVGYMGDGINDGSALHVADVGISVDNAVDVAKEAAAIVLLKKDLSVLARGVQEGRKTFANTLKYVYMATSANFGNMFSMAGASLFLAFLPLLPGQILLTNLLTDLPETTIATDNVDKEMVVRPHCWDIAFIRRFMLVFGIVSSVFDYMTFAILLLVLGASTEQFRTGWFMESVVSASLIVLVVRTRRPFFRSRPSRYLIAATTIIVIVTLALPYTPLGPILGFQPLPADFLAFLALIVTLYVGSAELTKRVFYRRFPS